MNTQGARCLLAAGGYAFSQLFGACAPDEAAQSSPSRQEQNCSAPFRVVEDEFGVLHFQTLYDSTGNLQSCTGNYREVDQYNPDGVCGANGLLGSPEGNGNHGVNMTKNEDGTITETLFCWDAAGGVFQFDKTLH